jgi:indole-3-glycerol phosphate synthase
MDILKDIIAQKRVRLAKAQAVCAPEVLRVRAREVRRSAMPHRLRAALSESERFNVIAEMKRASPSKGLIREGVEPAAMAKSYEAGGAAAISVLTEADRFRGSLEDLRTVRAAVELPLLRKDFIFDEYQLDEAVLAGADALLLIVAALDDETLARLRRMTEDELGMDALVEVHDLDELRRAEKCGATLIGVNNRNLRTFDVSLKVSIELAQHAASDSILVSESGLRTNEDLRELHALGYRGFLIGETLMRSSHPVEELRALCEMNGV